MSVETTTSATAVWDGCLQLVKQRLNPLSYHTWFEPLVAKSLEDSLLTVEVPSTYFYEWLEEHYFALIQEALKEVMGEQARLQYAVRAPTNLLLSSTPSPQLRSSTDPALPHGTMASSRIGRPAHESNLNAKFTFESFIRGDGNQFARAASLNVAKNPGATAFNPLFIYGGVGLGKTHLLQAIGNAAFESRPDLRVLYVSSERFTIDFVDAIEKNRTIDFSSFYRTMDVLIVDDIQFFSGKERTQDTFFHIFNTLFQLKKQIILSSDRAPKDLVGLDERLISRFQCGLSVDIQPPDLETRIAILRKKAESDHLEIPQEVIDFIASNVKSNIRELEGCYIGLLARHTLEQRPMDVQLAEVVLRNVISSEKKVLTIERIQKLVAEHFKIPENSLRAKTRRKEIVVPRQIAMYLAKEHTDSSLKTIGLHFGGRDHSTIIHACRTVKHDVSMDETVRGHVLELEKKITYLSM
jgi:chromosomal replication initiator protein